VRPAAGNARRANRGPGRVRRARAESVAPITVICIVQRVRGDESPAGPPEAGPRRMGRAAVPIPYAGAG
jgi:hypothetical protein